MYIKKFGRLYEFHPSFYIGQSVTPLFLRRIVDISTENKLPFHVWFHLWDFGETKEAMQRFTKKVFFPLLEYAKKKERSSVLTFETML